MSNVVHQPDPAKSDSDDQTVVDFPASKETSQEEGARRIMAEATRLAGLAPGEWKIWIDGSAERLGIVRDKLEAVVVEIIKANQKSKREGQAEARRIEQRAEKSRKEADRKREREQQRIDRDAERKSKEKAKAFAAIIRLPVDQHEAELAELAKQLDLDLAVLREEFSELVGVEASGDSIRLGDWHVEPWRDPVTTAAVLEEVVAKISKHVVARPYEILVIALWALMSWVHDVAATHSAYLVATSAEPDSGKTTLLGVIGYLVPKPFIGAEPTGPTIYRFVDHHKPTLIIDEADDLFIRKSDVAHIFNIAWTRGTRVPRQERIDDLFVTVWFDPYCPKVVGLLGMKLPRPLAGRSIVIKLWPKKPEEKVENFNHIDDEEFANLRRKLARWTQDNAAALKDAKPVFPANFNNRLRANWRLLFGIAELGAGTWPKQARDAAERLARTIRKPSYGLQLLERFHAFLVTAKRKEITSQQVVEELNADRNGVWCEYSRGGPITQRQVADLLDQYDIHPTVIHPTKRKDLSLNGYQVEQFAEAFARLLPSIRTSKHQTKTGK
jgi:putative DNA primase/helicase